MNTTTKKSRRMARPPYVEESGTANPDDQSAIELTAVAATEKRATKRGLVLALLQRDAGVSLAEIVEVTSWLPHTGRAALTGLRKKGHAITKSKVDGTTLYSIAASSAE